MYTHCIKRNHAWPLLVIFAANHVTKTIVSFSQLACDKNNCSTSDVATITDSRIISCH